MMERVLEGVISSKDDILKHESTSEDHDACYDLALRCHLSYLVIYPEHDVVAIAHTLRSALMHARKRSSFAS